MVFRPKSKFYSIIGLAGVHPHENVKAQFWGRLFEWPMIFLALWILILWHFQISGQAHPVFITLTDVFIWMFFVLELVTFTYLVDDKSRYLKTNWLNVLIVVLGIPVLWGQFTFVPLLRGARLFLMFALIVSAFDFFQQALSKKQIGITLGVSFLFITIAGILVAGIDPAVENPWVGIWWAWVTVTTVGYGDVVPASVLGKLLAGFLMLFGLALFSLITASFSAFFVCQSERGIEKKEQVTIHKLDKTYALLCDVNRRLEKLEQKMGLVLDTDPQNEEDEKRLEP